MVDIVAVVVIMTGNSDHHTPFTFKGMGWNILPTRTEDRGGLCGRTLRSKFNRERERENKDGEEMKRQGVTRARDLDGKTSNTRSTHKHTATTIISLIDTD